jgi:hypothetical protein
LHIVLQKNTNNSFERTYLQLLDVGLEGVVVVVPVRRLDVEDVVVECTQGANVLFEGGLRVRSLLLGLFEGIVVGALGASF